MGKENSFRFFRKKQAAALPVLIGISSLEHSMDTTFFCIAVSNYLCSKCGKAVACVELNTSGHFSSMAEYYGKQIHHRRFSVHGIDFYPDFSRELFSEIYEKSYFCCVLDFGNFNDTNTSEFLQYKQNFILCDLSPWKKKDLQFMLDRYIRDNYYRKSTTFLGKKGIYPHSDRLFAERSLILQNFPDLSDPFQITSSDFATFEKLLRRVYTTHVS